MIEAVYYMTKFLFYLEGFVLFALANEWLIKHRLDEVLNHIQL